MKRKGVQNDRYIYTQSISKVIYGMNSKDKGEIKSYWHLLEVEKYFLKPWRCKCAQTPAREGCRTFQKAKNSFMRSA